MISLVRSFEEDLQDAAIYHGHLCVGQFIGVRMARLGCALLGLAAPRECRDLFVFVEIDRCLADAVSVVTGCKIGKRRFKHIDYGKSAAVFANNATGEAVRVASKSWMNIPKHEDLRPFFDRLTDEVLFKTGNVKISIPPEDLPGPPLIKIQCANCGEYITDKRHVIQEGRALCKPCAHGPYWQPL